MTASMTDYRVFPPYREIYPTVRLGEVAKKTKTDVRGGQHPLWDDQVNMPVPSGKTKMRVQLFDEDSTREDLISEGEIDLTKVLAEGEQDDWFPLTYKGRKAGEIYLELTFYAARPPPKRQPTRHVQHARPLSGGYARPPPPQPAATTSNPHRFSAPPSASEVSSAPSRYSNVGPAPYVPPRPPVQQEHMATPHMPPPITPSPSSSTGSHGYPPMHHQRPPPQQQQQQQQQPSGYPGAGAPTASYPPVSHGVSATPLLSAPYKPVPSPQPQYGGYQPMQGGGVAGFPQPQQPYPNQYGNYPPPTSAYPPPTPSMSFPEPQRFPGGYTPHNDGSATPYAAHQGAYPSPAPGGYPPHPPSGYPPQQGYPPQPGYPPY
ncbi:hypothetical protein EC973_001765 [Apophysomyces ossiformis]|uniref:C2 domain-containing protein n=1 Tax=Apophysomyces ossiformis TaxID=679940 RepID=A0A8H7BJ95_9FUNG|nr:hypothetical protein EC973_001765 [Apophysomyces ossiformis]